jgi:hypothetical protein
MLRYIPLTSHSTILFPSASVGFMDSNEMFKSEKKKFISNVCKELNCAIKSADIIYIFPKSVSLLK